MSWKITDKRTCSSTNQEVLRVAKENRTWWNGSGPSKVSHDANNRILFELKVLSLTYANLKRTLI